MCFVPNSLKVFAVHYFLLPSSYFHPVFMTNDAGIPKLRTKYFVLEHESTHLRVGIVCNGSVHLNSDQIPYFFTRFRSICSCFIHLPFLIQHHNTHIHCMIVFLWNHGQYLHIMLRIFQDVCPFSPGFIFENCALHFFACTQDYVGHKSTFFFS